MSTRSCVVIEGRSAGHLDLYRHFDGYPAEAGASLLVALKETDSPELVAARLLVEARDIDDPRPQYEITDAEQHGDLEHVYVVRRINVPPAWSIEHYARGRGNWEQDDWRQWTKQTYTAEGFAELVNQERREANARIIARGLDSEPYPMVSA